MAEEPGRMVWEPTTRRVAPEMVRRVGAGWPVWPFDIAGAARAVVEPSTTRDFDGSRLNVVPPIVTAPPPGVSVWDPPEPPMTTPDETCDAVKLPRVATGVGELLGGGFPICGVVASDGAVGVETMGAGELWESAGSWVLVSVGTEDWGSAGSWVLVSGSEGWFVLVAVFGSDGVEERVGVGVTSAGVGVEEARAGCGVPTGEGVGEAGTEENGIKSPPAVSV